MDLSLKSTRWENVRKRILTAIEEERRRNTRLVVPTTAPLDYPNVGQVGESGKRHEDIGGRVFVTVNAND